MLTIIAQYRWYHRCLSCFCFIFYHAVDVQSPFEIRRFKART